MEDRGEQAEACLHGCVSAPAAAAVDASTTPLLLPRTTAASPACFGGDQRRRVIQMLPVHRAWWAGSSTTNMKHTAAIGCSPRRSVVPGEDGRLRDERRHGGALLRVGFQRVADLPDSRSCRKGRHRCGGCHHPPASAGTACSRQQEQAQQQGQASVAHKLGKQGFAQITAWCGGPAGRGNTPSIVRAAAWCLRLLTACFDALICY